MNPTSKYILIAVGCLILVYIVLIVIKKYSTYLQWVPSPLSKEYYSHEEFKHLEEAPESFRRRRQEDVPESFRRRRQEEAPESFRRRRQEEAPESFRRRRQEDVPESFRRRRQKEVDTESFTHEEDAPEYFRQNVEAPDMQSVPMRPSLIPQIPPRFEQNEKNISNGQYNQDMMASPPSSTPLYSIIPGANYPAVNPLYTVDFDKLGKQEYYADVSKRVGGGKPELQNTKDLMPVPDMRHTTGMDPTDPSNFMYNRTIFGKLKRRYGNNVDFFRGDIDIKPEYRGWYDIRPPTEADVVQGYFSKYQDVQQETDVRDSNFMRTLTPDQVNKMNSNPGGKQGFQY